MEATSQLASSQFTPSEDPPPMQAKRSPGVALESGLCSCGSGLTARRCCDLAEDFYPMETSLAFVEAKGREAVTLFNEKKLYQAELLAIQLLELAPNLRSALRVLFELRKGQGQVEATITLGRRLENLPGTAAQRTAAALQLAQYLAVRRRYLDAGASAERAVSISPKNAAAHHLMAIIFTETKKLQIGERHYRIALDLDTQQDGLILANLAWNLKLQGRLTEAAQLYERAFKIKPDNKQAVGGYAQVEFLRGRREAALHILEDALSRWKEDRTLCLLRGLADLSMNRATLVLERFPHNSAHYLSPELYLRGQALDRLGRHADAMQDFMSASAAQDRDAHGVVKSEQISRMSSACKTYFTADRVIGLPRAKDTHAPSPVFLLGFPGSGTSLLEQLLATIPGVEAANQYLSVASVASSLPCHVQSKKTYPEVLEDTLFGDGLGALDRARATYELNRKSLGVERLETKFVTDRNAGNALYLGLIMLLFPHAPIIHVLKHPLDVAFSNFSSGRLLESGYGSSMLQISKAYADEMALIKHLKGQLTLRYLTVRHEDLVQTTDKSLKRIAEFLGLPVDLVPSAEKLQENSDYSDEQNSVYKGIREPLHHRTIYRYARYQRLAPEFFEPVQKILRPWIEELGYGDIQ